MNAVVKLDYREASYKFALGRLNQGFRSQALHVYRDANGQDAYYRIRLKHPDTGEKWIRPFWFDGQCFVKGEPPPPPGGKLLYGLDRLAAKPNERVFVVEGEWAADHLFRRGVLAITSGSASSAESADWTPLQGRDVTIWPDADVPGARYGATVAAKLVALKCKVKIIDLDALAMPEHGDAVDWLATNPKANAQDVMALATKVAESQESHGLATPEPLRRPTPPADRYPVDELGPILGPACASLRRVIQAPDAVCGASLLAVASLAVQGLADVYNDGRIHPLSLWLLTVAESGERKSAVDTEALRSAREYEKELASVYANEEVNHDAELEQWNARRNKAREDAKKNGGGGLAEAIREIGPQPESPLVPKLIVADFTAEGLVRLLATGRPSVGAFTDEAALVFGGHGMTKETVMRTAATLSKLWDSGTLDRVRAGEGATKLYGRRLALHLMAQPVIAERALSDDVLAGQGFLARCLLSWPESMAGSRSYVAESLRDDASLIQFASRISDLLRRPLALAEDQRNELQPRTIRMTEKAAAVWQEIHNRIEGAMKPTGRYAMVKAWASKSAEQLLRIAGVLTLLMQRLLMMQRS